MSITLASGLPAPQQKPSHKKLSLSSAKTAVPKVPTPFVV
jgi:hypothetical protein